MSANEVHQLGLAQIRHYQRQMSEVLLSMGYQEGSLLDRIQQSIHKNPYTNLDDTIVSTNVAEKYEAYFLQATSVLQSQFHQLPVRPLIAKQIPAYKAEASHKAYYTPPSIKKNRPGIVYFNLRDIHSQAFINIAALAHHEGIPGHHTQYTISRSLTHLPTFRRFIRNTAYVEGWAQYAEQLAFESGLLDDPIDRLGYFQLELLRAARLVIDTGLHHKRWTREAGIQYLVDTTGLSFTDATAEVERYLVFPGQALSYAVGKLKILELRKKAQQCLGSSFEIKDFHQEILGHGVLPLTVLEMVIDQWLDNRCQA